MARRQQQADRASRDSIPERMLGRLISCLRSQSDADAAAAAAALPTIARFASSSSLPADIMSLQLQLQSPASAAAQSASPPAAAASTVFSLTAAACGGDGVCGPMLCLPPSVAFDPMCDADNVWHEPMPDVALDSQRLWLRGLYWSFAIYICACIGLLVAHVISFGYQRSLDDASIVSSKQSCSQVYFVSVGNLAGLAVAPAILLLTRLIILARDLLGSASCRLARWRCSSTLRSCLKAARRCVPNCGCYGCCRIGSAATDAVDARGGSRGTTVAHPSSTISIATIRDRDQGGNDEAEAEGEGEAEAEASSTGASHSSVSSHQSAGSGSSRRCAYRRAGNGKSDARDADDDAASGSGNDDDSDDDEDGADRYGRIDGRRQTGCDQAVVWSGNFLLVFAILDVVFFTVWNFVSPFLLSSDNSTSCAEIARSVFDLQLVTSIFLWVFLGELLFLFMVTRLYSCCTQRLGYCLNEEQVCVLTVHNRLNLDYLCFSGIRAPIHSSLSLNFTNLHSLLVFRLLVVSFAARPHSRKARVGKD